MQVVGAAVGLSVGAAVVGLSVGAAVVGVSVGAAVGLSVGAAVVGLSVGAAVGLSEGAIETPFFPTFFFLNRGGFGFLKRGGFGGARELGVELSLGVASGIRGRFAIFNLRALSQILHAAMKMCECFEATCSS